MRIERQRATLIAHRTLTRNKERPSGIQEEDLRAAEEAVRRHPEVITAQLIAAALESEPPRRILQYRLKQATHVSLWTQEHVDTAGRKRFRKIAESELLSLHEGNFARHQIRPSEFAAWEGLEEVSVLQATVSAKTMAR